MRPLVSAAAGRRLAFVQLALVAISISACSTDATAPLTPSTAVLTVDASTATAFVALGPQPHVVTGADTASASTWEIAVNATTVTLGGTGAVTAFCLCQHDLDSDASIQTLTADAALATFESVGQSDIPAAGFQADVFNAHKWYRYNLTGNDHQIWPTFNVYLIKRGSSVYKVQLTNYYDVNGSPRHVTIRSAELRS